MASSSQEPGHYFFNVDLDLSAAFEPRNVFTELAHSPLVYSMLDETITKNGSWYQRYELEWGEDFEKTLQSLDEHDLKRPIMVLDFWCDVLESLSPDAREELGCFDKFELNVGLQSRADRHSSWFDVPHPTLQRISNLGASLATTVYWADEWYTWSRRRRKRLGYIR